MSDPTPFPEDILTEIGRVTIAASKLEFMLAQFAAEVLDGVDANQLLSRAGRVLPAAQKAADCLDSDLADAFGAWIEDASKLLAERHLIVHSTWLIRAASPGVGEYFGRHPRTQSETNPDPGRIREIALLLDQCSTDGFDLVFAHARILKENE